MSACSLFKVVLVGNRNVGKTSMVTKYCEGHFITDQAPTYTANFVIKNVYHNNTHYKLCIWDTSGNHSMVNYLEACCSDANAVILVYDVNDRKSFDDLEFWIPEVHKFCDEKAVKIIVGCKTDLLDDQNEQFNNEAYGYAQSKQCSLLFASNRIGHDVELVFNYVMEQLCDTYLPEANILKKGCKMNCAPSPLYRVQRFISKLRFCQPRKKSNIIDDESITTISSVVYNNDTNTTSNTSDTELVP